MKKIYISYKTRLITVIITLIVSTIFSTYLLLDSFNLFDKSLIDYTENNNMYYTVKLKENDLFEEDIMSANDNYIASLIDKININYEYNFKPEELIKGTYNYNVTATLNIVDSLTGDLYYTKDYKLIDTVPEHILKSDLKINNNIEIDYDYFNNIATKLLPYYSENAKANLYVNFEVNKDLDVTSFKNNNSITNLSISNIIIPLTNEEKNIKILSNNSNIQDVLYLIQHYDEDDDMKIYYSVIIDVIIMFLLIRLVKLLQSLKTKENKYDKKLQSIKRKYNKIIVDIETQPDFTEYKLTKVKSFNELLDVRNSFKEPIRFFEVASHNKGYFFIIYKNEVFVFTLKEADL